MRKLLCVNCTLQVLNMGGNPIGDDGLAHIMQGLCENNTLTEFTADECGLSDKGTIHGSYLQCFDRLQKIFLHDSCKWVERPCTKQNKFSYM